MSKKILGGILSIIVIAVLFSGVIFLRNMEYADANPEEEDFDLYGWAWSENIGWISFNSNSEDEDFDSAVDYSVTMDPNGSVEGYAWSENVGWIKFNDLGSNFPAAPYYSASVDIDGSLDGCSPGRICGWARALAGKEDPNDGWDGWINLGYSEDQNNPGISIVDNSSSYNYEFELLGWAWGSNVIGWISFNCDNSEIDACGEFSYKVETNFIAQRPKLKNLEIIEGNYCAKDEPPITLTWDYESSLSRDDNPKPTEIELQVVQNTFFDDDENCSPDCVFDPHQDSPGLYTDEYTLRRLEFGKDHLVRVRVWDEYGMVSEWAEKEIKTKVKYPSPDWELVRPEIPRVREATYFEDRTSYYDWDVSNNVSGDIIIKWYSEKAIPNTKEGPKDTHENFETEFQVEGEHEVTVTVTADVWHDDELLENEKCEITKTLETGVDREIPGWEEVSPY